jgi:invasion protein IalB
MRLNRHVIAAGAAAILLSPVAVLAAGPAAPAAPVAPAPAAAPAATPAAPATPAAGPAAQPKVPDAVKAWAKFCDPQSNGHTVCIVRKLAFNGTSIIASFILRVDQSKAVPTLAVAAVPVGVVLKPGLRWQIDKGKAQTLPYWRCTPQTCESEQLASAGFVNQLRKGQTLTLTAKDVNNKDLSLPIDLAGFAAAYDLKNAPTFAEYSQKLGQVETGVSSGQ